MHGNIEPTNLFYITAPSFQETPPFEYAPLFECDFY